MLGANFRPWGSAAWLLPKLRVHEWQVLGCISTEERCNAILHHIFPAAGLGRARFIEIEDLESDFLEECRGLRRARLAEFVRLAGGIGSVTSFELMDSPVLIKRFVDDALSDGTRNIVLDISCLPKRFFFPIVKLILKSTQVDNFVVSYTVPIKYADAQLAFEPQDWSFLPLFQREQSPPTPKCVRVVVGVGFLPFHLPELINHDYDDADITLILPFPPGPPQYQRNWKFVHDIYGDSWPDESHLRRVDAVDTSSCFDHLVSIAEDDSASTLFAPFGPKPHSLAMCLYAAKHDCDVYYTQPKYYHPHYSSGIKLSDGKPLTYTYAIRVNGRDLY